MTLEAPGVSSDVRLRILDLRQLDLRVGRIDNLEELHMTAGSYVALIDIGKEEDRVAPTELIKNYDLESLIDQRVVVACNLPYIWMDGVETNTKIMCGVADDKVELLEPPPKAEPGDRVFAEGFTQENYWILRKKNYDKVALDLKVNSSKQAVYKGVPLQVKGKEGFITTKTLTDCNITYV